ncbi:hypothetical protein CsSME_00002533 [Camellia sinensis var. sinensis]
MSMGSNIDTGYFQNKRCKRGKKVAVYISELEKNPRRQHFMCADKMCEYFAWGAAPTGNASNIQRRSKASHTKNEDERRYDYDFERNNEVMNRLERLEANQEAMKLIMFTTIVLVGDAQVNVTTAFVLYLGFEFSKP